MRFLSFKAEAFRSFDSGGEKRKKDIKKEMGSVITEETLNSSPVYDIRSNVLFFLFFHFFCLFPTEMNCNIFEETLVKFLSYI